MQSVTIVCVGKCKERYWREACEEYAKRLGAFCRFSIVEVEEERCPDHPSEAQIAAVLQREGERIQKAMPPHAYAMALCIEGQPCTSEQLSARLSNLAVEGESQVAFVVGGSFGLSPQVKSICRERMSMSRMTFPHQLARVMLCEQIYRAYQISSGGKYHK